jgi:hypothetical protein
VEEEPVHDLRSDLDHGPYLVPVGDLGDSRAGVDHQPRNLLDRHPAPGDLAREQSSPRTGHCARQKGGAWLWLEEARAGLSRASTTGGRLEMRRVIGIALLAVALVVGNVTLTSANASDNGDNDDVIRLVAKTVVDEFVDLAPKGEPNAGDHTVFSDDVYWNGNKVGFLDGTCTFTRVGATAGRFHCTVTLTLPEGQITLQGTIRIPFEEDFTGPFYVAITGGTGAYDEAQGQVRVRIISDTEERLTVMLN